MPPAETYLSAALRVLKDAGRPLTAREIVDAARTAGLLPGRGKTPEQTMLARLYVTVRDDPNSPVVRLYEPGPNRARRNSVRWTLRSSGEPSTGDALE